LHIANRKAAEALVVDGEDKKDGEDNKPIEEKNDSEYLRPMKNFEVSTTGVE
jgi:hypothetical protein